ncbi:hypothetical protein CHUAL_009730 [Chamberlinius hualienensis]
MLTSMNNYHPGPTPNVLTVVPAKTNPPIAASTSTTTQHTPFKCFICGSKQHRARKCSFYGRSKAYMVIKDDEKAAHPIEEDEDNSSNPIETIQLVGSPKTLERKHHPPMVLIDLGIITEDALLDTTYLLTGCMTIVKLPKFLWSKWISK